MEEKSENVSRNFTNYEKPVIKRSSYILALISINDFLKKGAILLNSGIYWIKKEYDGTPTNETCALIGIPVKNISNFLLDDNSEFMTNIRQEKELTYVNSIDKLTCRFIQNAISKFYKFIGENILDNELALFNIEPKGDGPLEKSYPVPRITIPGGTMEDKDFLDFEKCALREFKEETGLDITSCHEKLSREKFKKGFRFTHFTNYKKQLKTFYVRNKNDNNTKYIYMYYLMRIQ